MKGKKVLITILVFAVIMFTIFMVIVMSEEESRLQARQPVTLIETTPVIQRTVTETLEAVGTAKAYESVTISANVTEYISQLHFEDGDRVQKGDILVELETAEEMAQLQEAEARLMEARLQFKRIQNLVKRDFSSQAELDTLKANADSAKAQLERIKTTIADRSITAPFDGILGFRKVSEGALLEPGDQIVTLDMIQPLRIDFSVPEKYLNQIRVGQAFKARSIAYAEDIITGKIATVDSRIDEQTRSVIVRGQMDNQQLKLKPGMLLKISLPIASRQVLTIPEEALLAQGNKRYIFIVPRGGNIAERHEVKIISREGPLINIDSEIDPDALVVTRGAFKLQDGQKVKIKNVAQ